MPRYEIAIANATANKTWGNDLPRRPLWGTMGQIIPLLERRGILPEMLEQSIARAFLSLTSNFSPQFYTFNYICGGHK